MSGSILWRVRHNLGWGVQRLHQRILFLHPPKCGGTSVFHAIKKAYGVRASLSRGFTRKLGNRVSAETAKRLGLDLAEYRDGLLGYFLAQDPVFVCGHFSWPSEAVLDEAEPWAKVTIVREPVSRWFSHYFFNTGIDSGERDASPGEVRAKLEGFLDAEPVRAAAMGSTYVTTFAGVGEARTVERARENLDRFDVVGRIEDVPGFVAAFRDRFGVTLAVPELNRGHGVTRDFEGLLGEELLARVTALCAPNLALYEHVEGRA